MLKKDRVQKSAHKLTDEILTFIEEQVEEGKPLRARVIAPLIKEKFDKDVHPRSIERAMARRKKAKTTLRNISALSKSDSALSQYESLREQALNRTDFFLSVVWAWHSLYTEGCLPG